MSKKTSTINLLGFETLELKTRRLKLWKPTVWHILQEVPGPGDYTYTYIYIYISLSLYIYIYIHIYIYIYIYDNQEPFGGGAFSTCPDRETRTAVDTLNRTSWSLVPYGITRGDQPAVDNSKVEPSAPTKSMLPTLNPRPTTIHPHTSTIHTYYTSTTLETIHPPYLETCTAVERSNLICFICYL